MLRILFVSLFAVFLVVSAPYTYAFQEKGEDCMKCHKLDRNEVVSILQKLRAPEAKILEIKMSPVKGLWQVSAENRGKFIVLYVDFSKNYLMAGTLFDYRTGVDLTLKKITELEQARRIDTSGLSLEEALVIGKKTASTKVIVFSDPD
jgi:thiol:disulfide interchange protein DsbC